MDGGSNQPTRTISDVAHSCIEMFHRCLSRDRSAFAKLEGDERRFWAWSNSLNVFEEQQINLDSQLEKHAQIREMVLLLLGVLKDNLSLALSIIIAIDALFLAFNCEISPEASDRNVLEIPFFGIDGSLRRLEKIGTAIAHATHASLTRRVLLYAKKQDDYQELSRTFSLSILFRYRGLGPDDMPMFDVPAELIPSPDKIMAPQPPGLFLSLVKTSLVRHYRICYQRNKIEKDIKKPAPQVVSVKNIKTPEVDLNRAEQRSKQPDNLPHKEPPELNPGHKTQSEAMSNTLTLETAVFKKKLGEDASSSGSRAWGQPVSEAGAAIIPRPPKMPDGQKSGICPICKQNLPANIFESRLSWISHVYKDIKPYVCISEDCMSNLQFFEDSSSWINHMHKIHTTRWVQYLHNTYKWNCPFCHDVSPTEFLSKHEMEQNFIGHLEQDHSAVIEKSNRRHLASVSGIPRHRPLDTCPICGTHHQLMPLSETPHMPQNDEANYKTEDAVGSKLRDSSKATSSTKNARFEDCPISDSEERKQSTKVNADLALQPPDVRSSKPTRLTGVEKCIGDHLKGIAFYFSSRLIEEEYEDRSEDGHKSSRASKASVESTLLALTDLSSVGSKADPPQLPPAHYDGPIITDKEKEEVKLCIAKNSKELLESYKWNDNLRVEDLKLSSTELEDMFPDANRKSNDRIWKGMDPRYAIAYVACLVIALELCKKVLVAIEGRKSNKFLHIHEELEKFLDALEDFPGRGLDTKFDPRGYLTAIDECAAKIRAIFVALGPKLRLASDPQHFSNDNSATIMEKVIKIERTVRLRIVLADINGRFGDIDVLEDRELPPSLRSKARNLINQIVFELIQGNPAIFQAVGGRVERYLDENIEHQVIQDRLIDALQNPGFQEKKGFFPRDMLASLVDEECVVEELKGSLMVLDDNAIRDYARRICGVGTSKNNEETQPLYKKIFVTLALCEKTSSILKFLAEMVTDDDLPLVKVGRPGKSSGIFDLARRSKPNIPLTCFQGWSIIPIRSFEEWQWATISPFFARSKDRKNVNHFILQDQVVLPFISDSRRDSIPQEILEYKGGYGQVFKVSIHPEHHDFHVPRTKNRSFAIKCLLSRNKDEFDHEVEMLKKFSGDSHPHLVSLLATYEQFQRFYLIFHWAEADLNDYWKDRNPRPLADYKTILWVAQQCEGIANGLQKIHHYESSSSKDQSKSMGKVRPLSSHNLAPPSHHAQLFGRHGDIKPNNVLLFSDPDDDGPIGTLKLTDFGLTEFSSVDSTFYEPESKVAISPSYRAPECDLQDGVIGRSYDIWTLGCLYLEFITWLLGGWKLVEQFTEKRLTTDAFCYDIPTDTFFEIVKCGSTGLPGAMIKPAVTDFILDLHAHPKCTEYCHEFLQLIQDDMMIVKPNDPNVRGRIGCEQVDQSLSKMLRNCVKDADYASKPAPWSRSRMERITTIQRPVEADTREPGVEVLLRKDLRIHN